MDIDFPMRPDQGFDALYGLEVLELTDELVRGRVAIDERHLQPAGLVHGGVICAVAEALASFATYVAVEPEGKTAQGLANVTSFLRPILDGHLNAEGRRRHRGRTTWVWEVDFADDEGRLCALTRMTIAVR